MMGALLGSPLVIVYGQMHDPLPVILIHGFRQSEVSQYLGKLLSGEY